MFALLNLEFDYILLSIDWSLSAFGKNLASLGYSSVSPGLMYDSSIAAFVCSTIPDSPFKASEL